MRVLDAGRDYARLSRVSEAMLALSFCAGRPDFDEATIGAVGRLLQVDHMSAFDDQEDGAIQLRLAASSADRSVSPRLSRIYAERFHRCDPLPRSLDEPNVSVFLMSPEDVLDPQYRAECYDLPGIVERITIRSGRHTLNLYRGHANGPFQDQDTAVAVEAAAMLFPLLDHHARLLLRQPANSRAGLTGIAARLRAMCPALTGREVDVLARGLIGMTSEGTGLDLGIRTTSVATYRKRAYHRLDISTQAELYGRLMQAQPMAQG